MVGKSKQVSQWRMLGEPAALIPAQPLRIRQGFLEEILSKLNLKPKGHVEVQQELAA